ncbi:MAG: oxygen-independent coproporphyrinogen III oxidase [Candidatus Omnitrophica bacterium]|nr:oxygen-independent coproporphyrinogen III oxidase [Candidatus Omnitrophota bacterium]
MLINKSTIEKFDVPGPRYTSYPTAPEWSESVDSRVYEQKLKQLKNSDKTLSLYVHIPFCVSMCTYCACNVVIRPKNLKYGDQYIDYLNKEIDLLLKHLGEQKPIKQLHFGGGTPTFLTSEQLTALMGKIQKHFKILDDAEVAIEIDPRTIDLPKVKVLKELGFNRVSMGVQDFDEDVQREVNRIQPFDQVKAFYDYCRELEFDSVNFDLIYGLPRQSPETFEQTLNLVSELKPDRIALYSFAYVPWLKKHQNKIRKEDLPTNDQKLDIFLFARQHFLSTGYEAIAMDHFALADDELARAYNTGTLYRNFMGYTVKPADEYIGLGLTSIGYLENTFIQNEKVLPRYYRMLDEGRLPVERGKELTEDDLIRQWVIRSLMCHFMLDTKEFSRQFEIDFNDYFSAEQPHIDYCLTEELLHQENSVFMVTDLGKLFVRNICMGFDQYFQQKKKERRFSQTV